MVEKALPQQDLGPHSAQETLLLTFLRVLGGSGELSAPPYKAVPVQHMHIAFCLQFLRVPIKQNLIAAF